MNHFESKGKNYYTIYGKCKIASKVELMKTWEQVLTKAMVNIRKMKIKETNEEIRKLNTQLSLDL